MGPAIEQKRRRHQGHAKQRAQSGAQLGAQSGAQSVQMLQRLAVEPLSSRYYYSRPSTSGLEGEE